MEESRLPPGPPGHWLLGHAREARRDILGLLTRTATEYGGISMLRQGPFRLYVVTDPAAIEQVLLDRDDRFRKHFAIRLLGPVLGNGLLNSEGSFWKRQRRLAAGAFHRRNIDAYARAMVAHTERMLAGWSDGQTVDIHAEMMKLTLSIVIETLFGSEVTGDVDEVGDAMAVVQETFTARVTRVVPVPEFVPTRANRRMRAAVARLDRFVYDLIASRRGIAGDRGDLLSMLLAARDEDDGTQMTDAQVRDEVVTFLLAGHETTALALSWTFYLLAQHPGVMDAVRDEAQRLPDAPATADRIKQLPYAERVIKEAMRLYPPAWIIGREAASECELGGYRVPRGTTILMPPWVIHRLPGVFPDPERFDPERWAEPGDRSRYSYMPFGGGPRICIGNAFAMLEAVLILASVVQRFRCRLVPGHPVEVQPDITLRPRHGIRVILEGQAASGAQAEAV